MEQSSGDKTKVSSAISEPKETEEFYVKVQSSKSGTKKNCCIFCKKTIAQLPRHLEKLHKNEDDVKNLLQFPKGSSERKEILNILRKRGNYIYNTSSETNKGDLIVCRRPKSEKEKNQSDFYCCPVCKGFFSKTALRKHYRRCCISMKKGERRMMALSRKARGNIHKDANYVVKKEIFPILRDDEVTRCIRYDSLVIAFSNRMSLHYRSKHHHKMIRARLRLIGRFLIEMRRLVKSNDDLNGKFKHIDLTTVFQPELYNTVVEAVNTVAGYDPQNVRFKAPAVAFNLGILLKKICRILMTECIKKQDQKQKKIAKDFLNLIQDDWSTSVNKTVQENQCQQKREKQVILPHLEDIKKLNNYLKDQRTKLFKKLKFKFDEKTWLEFGSVLLTSIQVFNRRRAGEIERAHVNEVMNFHSIEKNLSKDIFDALTPEEKKIASRFVRVTIRGKLNRTVPLILPEELVECLRLYVGYRQEAKISSDNLYLFACSGSVGHLNACDLLRKFSVLCGAKNPEALRGTQLRKHIATFSVTLNLQEHLVADLAHHMGHSRKIHDDFYRMPQEARDLTNVSKLLEKAQGADEDEENGENVRQEAAEENLINRNTNADVPQSTHQDEEQTKVEDIVNHYIQRREMKTRDRKESNLIGMMEKVLQDIPESPQEPYPPSESSYQPSDDDNILSDNINSRRKVKRRGWSTPEKHIIRTVFGKNIRSKTLPNIQECEAVVQKYPLLQKRTAIQVKAWINNAIKKADVISRKGNIQSWFTPQKKLVRKQFAEFIKDQKLPPMGEIKKLINENPILKMKNPATVKSWIQAEISRSKRNKEKFLKREQIKKKLIF